jgi:hypothetical protein
VRVERVYEVSSSTRRLSGWPGGKGVSFTVRADLVKHVTFAPMCARCALAGVEALEQEGQGGRLIPVLGNSFIQPGHAAHYPLEELDDEEDEQELLLLLLLLLLRRKEGEQLLLLKLQNGKL